MKKFLTLLTVCVLFTTACKQEEIDIKNLSYKQLKKINYEDIASLEAQDLFLFDLSEESRIPLEITEDKASGSVSSFLKMNIDGKDYTFLVSTISPKTYILESFFMNSGIKAIPTEVDEQFIGFFPSVTIGNIEVRNIRAEGIRSSFIPTGMMFDGIIGADFFSQMERYNICFSEAYIDLAPNISDEMIELECLYYYDGFPVIDFLLNGEEKKAFIAIEELISLVFDYSLPIPSADAANYYTRSPYSHIQTSVTPLPALTIEIGSNSRESHFYSLEDITYFNQLNRQISSLGVQASYLLGGNFWIKNDLVLAPAENKCWIDPR